MDLLSLSAEWIIHIFNKIIMYQILCNVYIISTTNQNSEIPLYLNCKLYYSLLDIVRSNCLKT